MGGACEDRERQAAMSDPRTEEGEGRDEPTAVGLPVLIGETPLPTWIDRYIVVGELGRGGMSVVVSAYDPELERKVAIKLVSARGRAASSATSGCSR